MTESNNRQDSVRHYIKRDTAQARAYSQAVVTKGGRTVWLAGQVGAADASGKSLAGDFDGQVREVFSRLGQTLEQAGGALADMVTMTVFITDARYGDRFTQLRKEIFGDNFPASALITVAGLARPEMLVEVSGDRDTWLKSKTGSGGCADTVAIVIPLPLVAPSRRHRDVA